MNIFSKIGLSRRYGKAVYIISAVLTVPMSVVVLLKPLSIPVCIILKLISIPVIFYLRKSISRKQDIYFYLNLGISRNEYEIIPFAVEFLAFVLLIIITGNIGYAIR